MSDDKRYTYVGSTIDLDRRLQQHNGEKSGGAKYTTSKGKGVWHRHCYVTNFPTWNDALKFEWKWKQVTRLKKRREKTPLENRMYALEKLLLMDKSTFTSTPFAEYEKKLEVIYEELFPTIYH